MGGTFTVKISPDGLNIEVDVNGVVGQSCTDLTSVFNKLGQDINTEKKAEYYLNTEETIDVIM